MAPGPAAAKPPNAPAACAPVILHGAWPKGPPDGPACTCGPCPCDCCVTAAATAAAAEASVRGGIWCEGTICVEQMEIRGVCAVYVGQWGCTAVGGGSWCTRCDGCWCCCCCGGCWWWPLWWCTTRCGNGGPAAEAAAWCDPLPEDICCWNRLLGMGPPPFVSLLLLMSGPRMFRMWWLLLLLLRSCVLCCCCM